MSRSRLLPQVGLMLAAAVSCSWGWSQEAIPTALPVPSPQEANDALDEAPTPLFNDQLRRFKFLLEHEAATWEAVEVFMLRYNGGENPEIVGAYPDAESNSLIVIGPPTAEQAIRECLAQWVVESQQLAPAPSLSMQLRLLVRKRGELLNLMAATEVEKVAAAPHPDEDTAKKQELARKEQKLGDVLQEFEKELQVVERQIGVVRKYIDRLERESLPRPSSE